jgi:hypothetical protein
MEPTRANNFSFTFHLFFFFTARVILGFFFHSSIYNKTCSSKGLPTSLNICAFQERNFISPTPRLFTSLCAGCPLPAPYIFLNIGSFGKPQAALHSSVGCMSLLWARTMHFHLRELTETSCILDLATMVSGLLTIQNQQAWHKREVLSERPDGTARRPHLSRIKTATRAGAFVSM